MNRLTRRDFLRVSAMGLGAIVVSTGLSGCLSSSDSDDDRTVAFNHGIASGDPLTDRVLLWTRVTPEDGGMAGVRVGWEVASDESFSDMVLSGTTFARPENDFTVKVDALSLQPGQTYYYRFRTEGDVQSATGKTRTLPEGSVDQVKLAVLSCANYPAGYFHVYAEAAKEENLDAFLHLGDYLYEYGNGGYATEDAEALGRTFAADNKSELLTLRDYRKRYALYKTDQDLQTIHTVAPFIAVWDDHEVANDAWENGAGNHSPETEGDYSARKMQALQAYFEWMPIRPLNPNDEKTIYRSFQFGDLVSLHMLDTRLIARDKQLNYADYITDDGGINAGAFKADLTDQNRTMMGYNQLSWLRNQMALSTATWQVLGQQVLMGRITLPAELLTNFIDPDPATLLPAFSELAQIKGRIVAGDPTVTDTEKARVETVLPYNLDAWDGYFFEREVLLQTVNQYGKNLVVLAGDTHNAWASDLTDVDGNPAGVEFATASVSSPGFEDILQIPEASVAASEQALQLLVDDLHYLNISQRGYMVVTFTPEEARADWRFVSTIKDKEYSLDESRSQSLRTTPGSRRIVS